MGPHRLADDWWSQEPGRPTAHWELGWNEELATFYARLYMDYESGGLPDELRMPSDDQPVFSYGERPGELLEVDQLESAMSDETQGSRLPGDLVAKLEADRDRYLASLSPQASKELVERLAAAG